MIQKIKYYFQKEIWLKEVEKLSKSELYLVKQLRIVVMAFKGFDDDKIMLRASSLTFYSLLSFVPVIAMIFGIAKGFGLEEKINTLLLEKLGSQEEIMTNVMAFAHNMLSNTKGGLIAGIGTAVLFWSVIKVMTNIEKSFNAIWGVTKERPFIRKISEYLIIMLVAPLLLVVASSVTVFLTSSVESVVQSLDIEYIHGSARFFLKLLPYAIIWVLFGFIYMVMPNTKVSWKSAIFAAIVAGTVFELTQWAYVTFQIGVAGYNAIYGSFAAIPMFLVWMQTSWLIILFGGELSFAHQNVEQYRLEDESKKISSSYRKKLTLYVMHYIITRFSKGQGAPDFDAILKETKLPYRLLQSILTNLDEANVVSILKSEEYKVLRYQPAVDTDLLTTDYVLKAIENLGSDTEINMPSSDEFTKIGKLIEEGKSGLLKEV
ncbi:MAG: YihY/virulence factor BrkB family protein [Flavobacteriales bacterium]|nr:YihY/virulence factor BrkB family protein [Flavobacteriales bacterium]